MEPNKMMNEGNYFRNVRLRPPPLLLTCTNNRSQLIDHS